MAIIINRTILTNLRLLVRSNRIQAIFAVIAAFISLWQAYDAHESAESAKEDADRANRQVKAVEEAAQQAKLQAAAADRQAKAAEQSLAEARDLVDATRSLRDEASKSVEIAKEQLAQTRTDSYATRRAKVRFVNTELKELVVGEVVKMLNNFASTGLEEPLGARAVSYAATGVPYSTIRRSDLPDCINIQPTLGSNFAGGQITARSSLKWTQKLDSDFVNNRQNIYIYGRYCYYDSLGSEHRIDYCTFHTKDNDSGHCLITD